VLENLTVGVPELAEARVHKSSLAWARLRLGEAAMGEVFRRVAADPVASPVTAGAWWRGRLVLAVDGFTVDVAESKANRAGFGGPRVGTGTVRAGAYPQAKVVTLTECGSHGLRSAAIGAYAMPERELAEQLLGGLDEHQIVLFDAGFPSVRLCHALNTTGVGWVMRADPRIARRDVRPLGDASALAVMKMKGRHMSTQPEHQVTVRVIEYQVDAGDTIRLLTNLLDPDTAPAGELARLYAERWQAESAFREIKTIQQGHDYVLRSHRPTLVRQEIWAHLTLHVLLNRLATDLADHNGQDPDRISFIRVLKHARRSVITQTITLTKTAATDLRRWLNPTRSPRTSPRTLKHHRNRYKIRSTRSPGTPITTRAPARTITLTPLLT
jgi:Transposase DDE domain